MKKLAWYVGSSMLVCMPSLGMASDFNLPFVSAAGLGNVYSGWAASAEDASTGYSNPAGLIRIPQQEVVLSAIYLSGSSTFRGTTTPPFPPAAPQVGKASTSLSAFIPTFFYSVPISDRAVISFDSSAPFGLGTNYPKNSIVRYAATRSKVVVTDIGPSIGIKLTNQLSVGAGVDFENLNLTLDNMYGPPLSVPDAQGQNDIRGLGVGGHAGILYQLNPGTRIGATYHSQVMIHATGYSQVFAPSGNFRTTNQRSNAALPTLAELSIHHEFNSKWTVLGTFFYTHWSTLKQLTLQNTALPGGIFTSVTIPFNYHDTFDYSIGTNYQMNDQWKMRAGIEFLNAPSNNRNRSVVDPIGAATIIGLGAHFQQNKQLGYDVGYEHSFFKQTAINLVTPLTTATGHSNQATNIFGGQVTWDVV